MGLREGAGRLRAGLGPPVVSGSQPPRRPRPEERFRARDESSHLPGGVNDSPVVASPHPLSGDFGLDESVSRITVGIRGGAQADQRFGESVRPIPHSRTTSFRRSWEQDMIACSGKTKYIILATV